MEKVNKQQSWVEPLREAAYGKFRREYIAVLDKFQCSPAKCLKGWKAEESGPAVITYTEMSIIGTGQLVNNTNEVQILRTGEFQKTDTSSWSTVATNTRDFGMEIEGSIEFGPSFFKTSLRMMYHMDFSYSESHEKSGSESLSYTIVSQEISVPPHSNRYVYAYLKKGTATNQMNVKMDVQGYYTAIGKDHACKEICDKNTIYSLVKSMEPYMDMDRIAANNSKEAVCYTDEIEYTINAAFDVYVEVRDKPMEEGGQVLSSWSIDRNSLIIKRVES